MAGCAAMLALFRLDASQFATLLPKSITTAIGKSLSQELGGFPATTMVTIIITGILGAVIAPGLLRLFHVTSPLAQGLAIGTSAHAAGHRQGGGTGGYPGGRQQPGHCGNRGFSPWRAAPVMMLLVS